MITIHVFLVKSGQALEKTFGIGVFAITNTHFSYFSSSVASTRFKRKQKRFAAVELIQDCVQLIPQSSIGSNSTHVIGLARAFMQIRTTK